MLVLICKHCAVLHVLSRRSFLGNARLLWRVQWCASAELYTRTAMIWMKMMPAMEGEECPVECPYPPNQNASQCLNFLYETDLMINSNNLATLIVENLFVGDSMPLFIVNRKLAYNIFLVSDLLSHQPSKPTGIWFSRPSLKLRTPSPKPHPFLQVIKFIYLFQGTFQLLSVFHIDPSFSFSTTETDGPCGSPHSPRTQRWGGCSHPAGPGAPKQPGSPSLCRWHTTSDSRPWYMQRQWNK